MTDTTDAALAARASHLSNGLAPQSSPARAQDDNGCQHTSAAAEPQGLADAHRVDLLVDALLDGGGVVLPRKAVLQARLHDLRLLDLRVLWLHLQQGGSSASAPNYMHCCFNQLMTVLPHPDTWATIALPP